MEINHPAIYMICTICTEHWAPSLYSVFVSKWERNHDEESFKKIEWNFHNVSNAFCWLWSVTLVFFPLLKMEDTTLFFSDSIVFRIWNIFRNVDLVQVHECTSFIDNNSFSKNKFPLLLSFVVSHCLSCIAYAILVCNDIYSSILNV